jgi:hypothetical protein
MSRNATSTFRYNETRYERLVEHVESQISGFEIVSKRGNRLMKLLSVILFFNKRFMDGYITTLYPRVYVPDLPWNPERPVSRISVLAHEYVHMSDRKRLGWLFNILYLSPQLFAVLSLGGFFNPWWLVTLLFVLPIPSPGRAWLEFRGYRMTIAVRWWLTGQETNTVWVEQQFTGSGYYWMFPFKRILDSHIISAIENIKSDENLPPELSEIKEVLGV